MVICNSLEASKSVRVPCVRAARCCCWGRRGGRGQGGLRAGQPEQSVAGRGCLTTGSEFDPTTCFAVGRRGEYHVMP